MSSLELALGAGFGLKLVVPRSGDGRVKERVKRAYRVAQTTDAGRTEPTEYAASPQQAMMTGDLELWSRVEEIDR
jgi:hypothetical protein